MENFEEKLIQMTKPQVSQLKHQDMLANAISKAKDKAVLSWWWLCIPIYLIAALLMKTLFMPHTTLILNIHELTNKEKYSSLLFFIILPTFFILLNLISIRKIYFLSGSPKTISFLRSVWFNVIVIVASIIILIIYTF